MNATAPTLVGPANALAATGQTWRYVRELAAATPGVRVIRSGVAGRIIGVVAEDLARVLARPVGTAPLELEAVDDEPEPTPEQPQSADEVLARLGLRRRSA